MQYHLFNVKLRRVNAEQGKQNREVRCGDDMRQPGS